MEQALRRLAPDAGRAVVDHVGRIKHDLGKYVALQARWLGEEATLDQRRAAVRQDLLTTRRGPGGTRDAVSLWGQLRGPLVGEEPLDGGAVVDLSDDPGVRAVDASMTQIEALVPLLTEQAPADIVDSARQAAFACGEAVRDLNHRARHAWQEAR